MAIAPESRTGVLLAAIGALVFAGLVYFQDDIRRVLGIQNIKAVEAGSGAPPRLPTKTTREYTSPNIYK